MKKLLAFILVTAMVLSIVACAAPKGETKPSGTVSKETAAQTSAAQSSPKADPNDKSKSIALVLQQGGLGDKGYNDDAAAGLEKLKKEYGMDYVTVEPTDLAQGETYLRELGDQGYGVIVSIEYGIKDFMYKVAPDYPNTIFVIFGKYSNDKLKASENVVELTFNYSEHSYIAGVIAAYLAEGNTIIDGVGQRDGVNIGVVCATESLGFYRYSDGFMQGAKEYDPNCNVYVDYTVGFTDTALCATTVENMIKNMNCDVVWSCCGTAGLGGLQACRLNKAFAVGVDCNQDYIEPGTIVTSVMRNTATSVYQIGTMFKEGKLKGSQLNCNVKNGILDVTDMSTISKYVTNQEKFKELQALVKQTKQDIIDGKIKVHDCAVDGVRYADMIKSGEAAKLNKGYTFYGK